MNSQRSTLEKDPWTLLVAVGFGSLMGVLVANSIPFLIGGLIDGLGFTEIQGGVIGSVEMAALAITAIAVAPLLARVSRMKVALAGGAVAAIAEFACIGLTDYGVLLAARLLTGVALGLAFAAATATAAAARNPDRVYGVAIAMSLVFAAAAFFPALGFAVEQAAHRGVFLILGVVVCIATMTFPWLRTKNAAASSELPATPIPWRETLILLSIVALFNLGTGAIWSFTERIGVAIDLAQQKIAVYIGFTSLVGVGAALLSARLGAQYGRAWPMLFGLALCCGAALVLAYASGAVSFVSGLVLYWLGYMFMYPFTVATGASLDRSGRVAAIVAGFTMIVFAAGPTVGGIIAELSSYKVIGIVSASICAAGALVAMSAGRALNTPPGILTEHEGLP